MKIKKIFGKRLCIYINKKKKKKKKKYKSYNFLIYYINIGNNQDVKIIYNIN